VPASRGSAATPSHESYGQTTENFQSGCDVNGGAQFGTTVTVTRVPVRTKGSTLSIHLPKPSQHHPPGLPQPGMTPYDECEQPQWAMTHSEPPDCQLNTSTAAGMSVRKSPQGLAAGVRDHLTPSERAHQARAILGDAAARDGGCRRSGRPSECSRRRLKRASSSAPTDGRRIRKSKLISTVAVERRASAAHQIENLSCDRQHDTTAPPCRT
jgi:hypothetical protein